MQAKSSTLHAASKSAGCASSDADLAKRARAQKAILVYLERMGAICVSLVQLELPDEFSIRGLESAAEHLVQRGLIRRGSVIGTYERI